MIYVIPVIVQGSNTFVISQSIYSAIGKSKTVGNSPGKLRQKSSALTGNMVSGRSKVSYAEVSGPHALGERFQLASEIWFAPVSHS